MDSVESLNGSQDWTYACDLTDLQIKRRKVVRLQNKQIALFYEEKGVFACNNRCPHEGYPLSEGTVDSACRLTCNWHNWKFDLEDGRNLYGGDNVRIYPIVVTDGKVYLDITDPPLEEQIAVVLNDLQRAVYDNNFTRIAREITRLLHLGVSGPEIVSHAIEWSYMRLEYGWTHAYAGAADWLTLYEANEGNFEKQVCCLVEIVGHIADDILRRPEYGYPEEVERFSETGFLEAIEHEDETSAIAQLRGALASGLQIGDLEYALSSAALRHYNDFGHALIYVTKAVSLIHRLGSEVSLPLLLPLVRSLVWARREDLIPKFRHYGEVLGTWQQSNSMDCPSLSELRDLSINHALDRVNKSSGTPPLELFDTLLTVNANHMLHFDLDLQYRQDNNVEDNVGWLDFTHSLTFANAVHKQCSRYTDLWPQGLLQMAMFAGRNHLYTDYAQDVSEWQVSHMDRFYDSSKTMLYDHGQQEFIVSVHLVKTLLAAEEEASSGSERASEAVSAAMNRFLHSPLRRKNLTRTVKQAIQLVTYDD